MPRVWDLAHAVPEALAELRKAVESGAARAEPATEPQDPTAEQAPA